MMQDTRGYHALPDIDGRIDDGIGGSEGVTPYVTFGSNRSVKNGVRGGE